MTIKQVGLVSFRFNYKSIKILKKKLYVLLSTLEASINTLVSPLGGILSATVLDQFGRKFTLVLINIFSITAWSLLYFSSSKDFDSMYWQIMLGRFFIGKHRTHVIADV